MRDCAMAYDIHNIEKSIYKYLYDYIKLLQWLQTISYPENRDGRHDAAVYIVRI